MILPSCTAFPLEVPLSDSLRIFEKVRKKTYIDIEEANKKEKEFEENKKRHEMTSMRQTSIIQQQKPFIQNDHRQSMRQTSVTNRERSKTNIFGLFRKKPNTYQLS